MHLFQWTYAAWKMSWYFAASFNYLGRARIAIEYGIGAGTGESSVFLFWRLLGKCGRGRPSKANQLLQSLLVGYSVSKMPLLAYASICEGPFCRTGRDSHPWHGVTVHMW